LSIKIKMSNYIVLARKYRPQKFDDLVGQDHVTRVLKNSFIQDRVHHAFLFCGERGTGKTTTARILARALCCAKGPTADPCNICEQCISILEGHAIDVQEIDGATHNGVAEIRKLTESVKYQPNYLRKKVIIIDEVHMLTEPAFAALLKTIEEPPSHATFIFATTNPSKLPATILSRVQQHNFKLVRRKSLIDHLISILDAEKIQADYGALAIIARESGGSVRDALSLLDVLVAKAAGAKITEQLVSESLGIARYTSIHTIFQAIILDKDMKSALLAIREMRDAGIEAIVIAQSILYKLRAASIIRRMENPKLILEETDDEITAIKSVTSGVTTELLQLLFDRMVKACEELVKSSVPDVILDMSILDAIHTAEPPKVIELPKAIEPDKAIQELYKVSSNISDNWHEFVVDMGKTKPILANVLANLKILEYSNISIKLGVNKSVIGSIVNTLLPSLKESIKAKFNVDTVICDEYPDHKPSVIEAETLRSQVVELVTKSCPIVMAVATNSESTIIEGKL
jgi:DNA polymerase-3 subunit gamma/tau